MSLADVSRSDCQLPDGASYRGSAMSADTIRCRKTYIMEWQKVDITEEDRVISV